MFFKEIGKRCDAMGSATKSLSEEIEGMDYHKKESREIFLKETTVAAFADLIAGEQTNIEFFLERLEEMRFGRR